ncbi:uncharacterized protein LOC135150410 [Daucus carota subsp. sativus]|uniref:uncharacterized protein LOC135150410 n=1 Tax=Daucus carota subsp. sativus TaxID=79200 RepID=UPI0030828039
MSNHGETTPGRNQPPDPRSGGGNNTPVDNTPSGNTPQDRAIIITDGEPVDMRRPISNSPPVFISNEELLKEFHYLRNKAREQQALRERIVQLESLVPGTHRSGKQPFEEDSQSGHHDDRRHVFVPRNLFASGGQTTIGGEGARDGGRPPQDRRAAAHLEEASRDINSLAERYRGRVSRADLLSLIKDLESRPEYASTGSRTTSTGRDGHRKEVPHGSDSKGYDRSKEQEPRGLGGRTERDPIVLEGRQSHGGTREHATSPGNGMIHQQTIADPHIQASSQANVPPSAQTPANQSNPLATTSDFTTTGTLPSTTPPQPNVQTIPGIGAIDVNSLRKLLAHFDGGQTSLSSQALSPFSAEVIEAPLPANYRNTTSDLKFHGNSDVVEFLGRFNVEMGVYQIPDLVRCRLLASTFRDNAYQWFRKLEPASIITWTNMQTMFLTQFQATVKYAPPVTTLANIKQKEGETLHAYFKRLRVGTDFWKHLQGNDPKSLADLYARAEAYKNVEQSLAESRKNERSPVKARQKRRDRSPSPEQRVRRRSPNRVNTTYKRNYTPPRDHEERGDHWTSLAAPIDHIFEVNRDKGLFRRPAPLNSWRAKNKDKYCEYHESTGHDTHECRQLKEEIESLIKEGHLNEWIVREARSRRDIRAKDKRGLGYTSDQERGKQEDIQFVKEGSIHVIFGGPHLAGKGTKAMERYAKEAKGRPLTNIHNLSSRPPKIFRGEAIDITFSEEDARWVHHPHNDALVIALRIGPMNVHRVLVDNGSSVNILYYSTYQKLGLPDKDMKVEDVYIYGFGREAVKVKGTIRLPVTLGEGTCSATQVMDFMIVDHDSSHNTIVGRPLLKEMRVVTSIYHLFMKFPTPGGIGIVRGCQYDSRECYLQSLKGFRKSRSLKEPTDANASEVVNLTYIVQFPDEEDSFKRIKGKEMMEVDSDAELKPCSIWEKGETSRTKEESDLDPRLPLESTKTGPAEDTIEIQVGEAKEAKVLRIGSKLKGELKANLIHFLRSNLDVFAWCHADMIGIDPGKRRPVSGERAQALKEEVDRLLGAKLIKESFYLTWLANPVLVKKPNGKWRTCVDFTDLNKACPKDSFPLPKIDQLVDATAGHALLSFTDAYSGYNQIPMHEPDQEHTSFITDRGLYCYIGMPFGLINAGATYQRLVNMMFKEQIGKTMEVYVDDMLVKSKEAQDHIQHLAEMFDILRKHRMKLNPQKCVFGVESGKFLGFMVNHWGIEANPAKIKALLDMKPPQNVRQVQSLTGRIAALNRFVSKSFDRCKEFFKAIKDAGLTFVWTDECEEAFQKIKEQLEKPPLLAKPVEGETLILYLAVSRYSVSAVLVKEEKDAQFPVYYVSKRLQDAETRYTSMIKLVYSLILAARKLRPYFQAHKIEVRTSYPLRQIMHKPEATGRLMEWAVELGQFDLDYKPRATIKGQALADFLLEFEDDAQEWAIVP